MILGVVLIFIGVALGTIFALIPLHFERQDIAIIQAGVGFVIVIIGVVIVIAEAMAVATPYLSS